MKANVKRAIRDQSGAALVLTLVLLLVGGLVIPPLLGFMFGGLIQGEVYERRAAELYAADAGVEDALWKIQNEAGGLPCNLSSPPKTYPEEGDPIFEVNGKSVEVSIRYADGQTYGINSTGIGDGSGTRIEAYVVSVYGNYTGITDNVLTSQAGISYPPKPIVDYPEGHGPVEYYEGPWPDLDALAAWYWEDVKEVTPLGSGTIDLNGADLTLGPLFRDGELTITNTGKVGTTLTLGGTLYVTGDLVFANTDMIIDLNGYAIFVESDSRNPPKHALYVSGKCTMRGPGVIAAIGDIYFEPNIEAGVTDPIFIISVNGTTTLKPGGEFYGAVAGSVEVDLGPGSSLTYPEDGFPGDLNWPGFDRGKTRYAIDSWTVTTLTL